VPGFAQKVPVTFSPGIVRGHFDLSGELTIDRHFTLPAALMASGDSSRLAWSAGHIRR
jgi:hypothetical protein